MIGDGDDEDNDSTRERAEHESTAPKKDGGRTSEDTVLQFAHHACCAPLGFLINACDEIQGYIDTYFQFMSCEEDSTSANAASPCKFGEARTVLQKTLGIQGHRGGTRT